MNLFLKKWNLFSTRSWVVQRAMLHNSQAPSDSLFLRISRAGQPNISMNCILDQWVQEGGHVRHFELQFFIKQLRSHRRFNHALQKSLRLILWHIPKESLSESLLKARPHLSHIMKVVPTSSEDLDHFMLTTLDPASSRTLRTWSSLFSLSSTMDKSTKY